MTNKSKNASTHPGAAHRGDTALPLATVGTLIMRVGGKYILRNGAEVEVRGRHEIPGPPRYVFFTGPKGSGLTWGQDGRYAATDIESGFDVVAEIEPDGGNMGR